ncbi:MAG: hypothetical protein WC108_03140 [Bacteroidales bacterium]|jgi:hypothetical protein
MKQNKNNPKQGINKTSSNNYSSLIITALIILASLILVYLSGLALGLSYFDMDTTGKMINQSFLFERIIINSIASILIAVVLNTYISIYLKTKSNFSLGLVIIAGSLFIQTLTANPFLLDLFNFRLVGSGLFSLVSSITTLIAIIALLYLSRT